MSIDTSVGRVEGVEGVELDYPLSRVSIDTSVQVSGQGSTKKAAPWGLGLK